MAEFPKLKTGAVAQYPYGRELVGETRIFRFLDGGEQRYRMRKGRRRWLVMLELLDEGEMARVAEAAARHLDTLEPFVFVDPWDQSVHTNCIIESDDVMVRAEAEGSCGMELVIAEEAA